MTFTHIQNGVSKALQGSAIVNPTVPSCGHRHKIWIDLDNSPHVPFFVPIVHELRQRGYNLLLTCRDSAQVLGLLKHTDLECRAYGSHYGKNKLIKIVGLTRRALQLAPLILKERPDLALSHGSRSQIGLSWLLRIPTITITDYEHARLRFAGIGPRWLMVPEILADSIQQMDSNYVLKYPGIKEDVYLPRFLPMQGIREELRISPDDLMVTIRPPANEAHYHNPQSDELFRSIVDFLGRVPSVRMVLLPRHKRQEHFARDLWPALFTSGKLRIPNQVVNGMNLIWFSDVVISGGGTMNREAAALGVPVYSIFRGKSGAVDRYLAAQGRLVLLENSDDLGIIRLVRRQRPQNPGSGEQRALATIIDHVTSTVESVCHHDVVRRPPPAI